MAIEMAAGFKIYSTDAVDTRFIMSKADMLSLEELAYPSTYFCVCTDDKSLYVFDSTNTYDASTGKFRIASGGGSYVLPAATDTTLGGVIVDNVTITVDENGLITGIDAYTKTEVDDLLNNKLNKPETDGVAGQILVLQDDGSLAYQDNVSEYDDTELRELIDTKLDKPETEGVVGQVLTVQEDGTNAYQDVPQYDDTELRELIDTKLDKEKVVQDLTMPDTESVLSTEALNTALETKVDKVENHSLVADTEIAKIHEHSNQDVLDKLSESDLGKLLYDGNAIGGSADAGGTADWITNVALGVLAANTDVTGLTALEILRKATVKYEEPTATVTFSQTNSVIKQGVTFNLDITVKNPIKKTSDIEKFDLYKSSTLVESIPYVSGTTSYSFAQIPDVAADCSYEVRVIDVQGKYTKYTKSYDFVHPIYTGCTDEIPVDATGLTEMIEAKGNKTITVNSGTGAYVVFMYDAAYGDLKNIIDPSGFENITSFTKIQLTINGILYNCYHSTLKQALSNFKYTYKF